MTRYLLDPDTGEKWCQGCGGIGGHVPGFPCASEPASGEDTDRMERADAADEEAVDPYVEYMGDE